MPDQPATGDLVELVRQTNDAWNRRDLDTFMSLHSPDVVYRPIATFTDTRERRGRDELRRFMEEFSEAWADDFTIQLDTVRVYGDTVIARLRFTGHAKASGIEIAERIFEVFRFRGGMIAGIEDFVDREDALRAVGELG
jgi:uncharacterized protein (TIGR02246 family)